MREILRLPERIQMSKGMFSKLLRKKRVLVGLTVAMLAVAGGAFAYFTSSGSGTGRAYVGTPTAWEVKVEPPNPGGVYLYPGSEGEKLPVFVKNTSGGTMRLHTVTAAPEAEGLNVVTASTGKGVPGCLASWFKVEPKVANPEQEVPSGEQFGEWVTVALENAPVDQTVCQGVEPVVTVNAS